MELLVTLVLVIWLRQILVQPISGIARESREGRAPDYIGVRELENLSDSIGQMMSEIGEHREQLEELVIERTAELEKARTRLVAYDFIFCDQTPISRLERILRREIIKFRQTAPMRGRAP